MKNKIYIILIIVLSVFKSNSYSQNNNNDSILKRENPKEYIHQLEIRIKELDSLLNVLSGEVVEDSTQFYEEEEIVEDIIDLEKKKRKPSSQQPQCLLSYNIPENNYLYYQKENQIEVVANGYFDTYIESSNAEVIPDLNNSLYYKIIPKQKGTCKLSIFGVTEKGIKVQLSVYEFEVKEKK